MSGIQKTVQSPRYAELVIYQGVARWVEVPADPTVDTSLQVQQILAQIDDTLKRIGRERRDLIEVTIFLADLQDVGTLNQHWDSWVDPESPPVRACVQAGLQFGYRAEFIVYAATL